MPHRLCNKNAINDTNRNPQSANFTGALLLLVWEVQFGNLYSRIKNRAMDEEVEHRTKLTLFVNGKEVKHFPVAVCLYVWHSVAFIALVIGVGN